jgi:hypothetical protein
MTVPLTKPLAKPDPCPGCDSSVTDVLEEQERKMRESGEEFNSKLKQHVQDGSVVIPPSPTPQPDLPPSRPTYKAGCDVQCQNERNTEQFKNGQAVGQALGQGIAAAIERHRQHKEFQQAENLTWTPKMERGESVLMYLSDGKAIVCPKGEETTCRTVTPPIGVRAHYEMEADRLTIWQAEEDASDSASLKAASDQVRTSWSEVRGIYCRYYPGAKYIDLDGNQQTCRK